MKIEGTIRCLACGSVDLELEKIEVRGPSSIHRLLVCSNCGSGTFDPTPQPDYTSHTSNEAALRDYVELNAGIGLLAGELISVARGVGKKRGRLLDVGCGYGFAADSVRRLEGWDVVGFEPSEYGARGAKALGIEVYQEHLTADHPVALNKYDIVHASEVIEHVASPATFVKVLADCLRNDGVLLLTTPDVSALDAADLNANQKIALLSPGFHTVLFSETGIRKLLAQFSFARVDISRRGPTLVVLATNRLDIAPEGPRLETGIAYMEALLLSGVSDVSLYNGLISRLFRAYIDANLMEKAHELMPEVKSLLVHTGLFDSGSEFYERNVVSAPMLYYYVGMYYLNHEENYQSAYYYFMLAYVNCMEKIRHIPGSAVVEADLIWRSLFHAGIAALNKGDTETAMSHISRLLHVEGRGMPDIPSDIVSRAMALVSEARLQAVALA